MASFSGTCARIIGGPLVGALLLAPAVVRAAAAAHTAAAATTVTYPIDDTVFANPERGFYTHTETHYRADDSGYTPLTAEQLAGYRAQGITQILRVFYLEKFAATAEIDPAYLRLVASDLSTAREAGMSVIVRFAYAQPTGSSPYARPYGDAPLDVALAHIAQLKSIFTRYSDVITVVQEGFIGLWGEGFYTDHFADPSNPDLVSEANWADRNTLLRALLAAVPRRRMVQVRTMAHQAAVSGDRERSRERTLAGSGVRANRSGSDRASQRLFPGFRQRLRHVPVRSDHPGPGVPGGRQ